MPQTLAARNRSKLLFLAVFVAVGCDKQVGEGIDAPSAAQPNGQDGDEDAQDEFSDSELDSGIEPEPEPEDPGSDDAGEPSEQPWPVPTPDPDAYYACNPQGHDGGVAWVANTAIGTLSKIDTASGEHLAMYATGPGEQIPVATSVGIAGHAVVANLGGTVATFAACESACQDRNEDGEIRTSTGPADVLPWGEDECLLWADAVPLSGEIGTMTVAWDPAERVWVGWRDAVQSVFVFQRREGVDGMPNEEVAVAGGRGEPIAAEVDARGNLWVVGNRGSLIRIRKYSLYVELWQNPGQRTFDVALDPAGDVWLPGWDGDLYRFDVSAKHFVFHDRLGDRLRGIAIDAEGGGWIATDGDGCGLVRYSTTDGTHTGDRVELPGCVTPDRVDIDGQGRVWVADRANRAAYRVDRQTLQAFRVDGFRTPKAIDTGAMFRERTGPITPQ